MTIYQVDAFTTEPFTGNPAGVCILREPVSEQLMQNIAAEINASETAFVLHDDSLFRIRYFTPSKEVPLCGHATLSSAHVLYETGIAASDETISFIARNNNLNVRQESGRLVMNFPHDGLTEVAIPDYFEQVCGCRPVELFKTDFGWHLALLESEEAVINANPDFRALLEHLLGELIITAVSDHDDYDIAVRCFAPASGIDEDPVTGSAQCAVTPFWYNKTGRTEFKVKQLSKRSGKLNTRYYPEGIDIYGQAITIFKADFSIDL